MTINIEKILIGTILLLFTSIYFGIFHLKLGFALKPYMLLTISATILFLTLIRFRRLFKFEVSMLLFIIIYSFTALNLYYPLKHLRFILAFIVVLMFYFITRALLDRLSIKKIEKIIEVSGFIGVSSSIVYYLMGIVKTGMNYYGNNITYYGLILDRSMPRLIGTVSDDPNIFVFFITTYFVYTINHLKSLSNKVGFLLSGIAIILSFSRGAYISIFIALIFQVLLESKTKTKIRGIVAVILSIFLFIAVGKLFSLDVLQVIQTRFQAIGSDGGSGRDVLWMNAIQTFRDHPLFGIGINSTTSYGLHNYNNGHYVHNTVLEVLSESGVVGFSSFIVFWLFVFSHTLKLYRLNKQTKFILITFIAMFFQMIFLSILYNEVFYLALALLSRYTAEYFNVNMKE